MFIWIHGVCSLGQLRKKRMASLLKKCEWCKHIKYGPGSVLTDDFFLLIDILSDSVSQREKEREREIPSSNKIIKLESLT